MTMNKQETYLTYPSPITPRRKYGGWMMSSSPTSDQSSVWSNNVANSPVDDRATKCVSDPELFRQLKTYAKESRVSTHFALQQILHEFYEEQQLQQEEQQPAAEEVTTKAPPMLPNLFTSAWNSMTESSSDISKSLECEASRTHKGSSFRNQTSFNQGGSDRMGGVR
uniref:Uncharacterized protein n=1 Tax=Grammatophora oceanica TaxID=210454 RepID=A0A7S1VJM5_9STRA|eukprot:CAMPEP_0194055020 /NCGR_PEP_ID=MMETSP0009_2-20130614/55313_1 /TAXON_ID=210454 /ORGANISM="Grammatophora oceanica, Strain CCMP 410" /LENGTH=166 /DNA_ID=CAMNT_0038703773 /DNA_START=52 /DNA_END=552 /DNA_ORIENTATION=-